MGFDVEWDGDILKNSMRVNIAQVKRKEGERRE
jgi:hypothetical protein